MGNQNKNTIMKIISTITQTEKKQQPVEFPCLMQSRKTGAVVYFTANKDGVVMIRGEGGIPFGFNYANFDMNNFEPCPPGFTLTLTVV